MTTMVGGNRLFILRDKESKLRARNKITNQTSNLSVIEAADHSPTVQSWQHLQKKDLVWNCTTMYAQIHRKKNPAVALMGQYISLLGTVTDTTICHFHHKKNTHNPDSSWCATPHFHAGTYASSEHHTRVKAILTFLEFIRYDNKRKKKLGQEWYLTANSAWRTNQLLKIHCYLFSFHFFFTLFFCCVSFSTA